MPKPAGVTAGPRSAPPSGSEDEAVTNRLTWLLVFRSLMMGVLLLVTVLANLTDPDLLSEPPQILVYVSAGLAFAVILAGALWQRRAAAWRLGAQIYLQIGGDVVVATLLIFATGGSDSTFLFLYSLSTINAAALRYRVGALTAATAGTLCFGLMVWAVHLGAGGQLLGLAQLPLHAALRAFLFNTSSLFLVAVLASYVSEQLRRTGESLEETRVDLTRLEALHGAVLSSLTSGLLALDRRGNVTLINRAGEGLLRVPAVSAVGQPVDALLPGAGSQLGREAGARWESVVSTEQGARVFGCSVAPLVTETGLEGGSVLTFQDLTEVRKLEEAIQRSERLATLGRFAAGLAHELRNPLGSLTGSIELLQRSVESPGGTELDSHAQTRLFEIVLREAERLNKLLTDFLLYARPTPSQRRAVELVGLLEETATVAAREISQSGESLVELDAGSEEVWVHGDVSQLKQVIWNLLRNGLQAAGAQGRVRIRVWAEPAGGTPIWGCFVVEDSGPGIAVELRNRVFDPFFTTKVGGTGLGLPTVQRIVEEHEGEFAIEDSALGGAAIRVSLPLSRAQPATTQGR